MYHQKRSNWCPLMIPSLAERHFSLEAWTSHMGPSSNQENQQQQLGNTFKPALGTTFHTFKLTAGTLLLGFLHSQCFSSDSPQTREASEVSHRSPLLDIAFTWNLLFCVPWTFSFILFILLPDVLGVLIYTSFPWRQWLTVVRTAWLLSRLGKAQVLTANVSSPLLSNDWLFGFLSISSVFMMTGATFQKEVTPSAFLHVTPTSPVCLRPNKPNHVCFPHKLVNLNACLPLTLTQFSVCCWKVVI